MTPDKQAVLDVIAGTMGTESMWRSEANLVLDALRDMDRAVLLRALGGTLLLRTVCNSVPDDRSELWVFIYGNVTSTLGVEP